VIEKGQPLPEGLLMLMGPEGPKPVNSSELCGSGTSIIFAVPGAFTPTCSAQHLPGFIERADEFRARGVDRLICLAVNDVFVMDAWGRQSGVDGSILMAADGNGDFSRALGLEMDASAFGMGQRSQRFAMIVRDGIVEDVFVEAPGEFRVSSADYLIDRL
jgi:peroxiredoxin